MKTTILFATVCQLLFVSTLLGQKTEQQNNQLLGRQAETNQQQDVRNDEPVGRTRPAIDDYDQQNWNERRRQPEPRRRAEETRIEYRLVTKIEQKYVYDERSGRTRLVDVEVQEWVPVEVSPEPIYPPEPVQPVGLRLAKLGVMLNQIGEHSFEVASVEYGSVGKQLGLRRGDRLTKINEERIVSYDQLVEATQHSFTIRFYRPSGNSFHWAEHRQWNPQWDPNWDPNWNNGSRGQHNSPFPDSVGRGGDFEGQ